MHAACAEDMVRQDSNNRPCVKLTLGDLVLSVLPWPFHKDLPKGYCGQNSKIGFWELVLFALPWPFHRNLPSDNESNGREGSNDK